MGQLGLGIIDWELLHPAEPKALAFSSPCTLYALASGGDFLRWRQSPSGMRFPFLLDS